MPCQRRTPRCPSFIGRSALVLVVDLVDLLLLVNAELAWAAVDEEKESTDDGQDLEEVVLGKVLVGVVLVESPEVVDQQVENAQNNNEQSGAVLGLESNDNHDAGDAAKRRDNDAPKRPLATEDKSNEEEDQEDTASQLEVHLAILLVDLGETCKDLSLANPRIRQDHDQATNDREVSEEEVEIEDETVTKSLSDDNAHETGDGVVGVLSDDDQGGAGEHGDDVDKQEQVGDAGGNVAVVLQVKQLIGPLGDDTESIFKEGDDNQETANGREIGLDRLADGVERILNLAGIGTNLLEKALALLRISRLGSAVGRGATEAVARVESVGHCCRVDVRFRRKLVSRADLLTR
jgi:hypothetical protein